MHFVNKFFSIFLPKWMMNIIEMIIIQYDNDGFNSINVIDNDGYNSISTWYSRSLSDELL